MAVDLYSVQVFCLIIAGLLFMFLAGTAVHLLYSSIRSVYIRHTNPVVRLEEEETISIESLNSLEDSGCYVSFNFTGLSETEDASMDLKEEKDVEKGVLDLKEDGGTITKKDVLVMQCVYHVY